MSLMGAPAIPGLMIGLWVIAVAVLVLYVMRRRRNRRPWKRPDLE
jgi:hypothetical protein